jgi:hypothetical protein
MRFKNDSLIMRKQVKEPRRLPTTEAHLAFAPLGPI